MAANGDVEKVVLAETPFETLLDWCEHTRSERGWDIGPQVGGSLVGDLVRAVEAWAVPSKSGSECGVRRGRFKTR